MKDILELTAVRSVEMPEAEIAGLTARTAFTTDLQNAGEVKRRIAEYVHMQGIARRAVRPADLNRRFGRVAKKYETSTAEITAQLLESERFITLHTKRVNAVYTASLYTEQLEAFKVIGFPEQRLIEELMENA